jgi:hypothetical protein
MRADEAFPSKYLKASDVKAKPIVAVISHIAPEMVGQGADQKRKFVLYFKNGNDKPLVLNRTNWDVIEDAFGDSDEWSGKSIKLRCAPTKYQGKSVDGIRVDAVDDPEEDEDE